MTPANRDFFAQNGFLKLSAFHSRRRLTGIRASVLNELKISFSGTGASKLRKLSIFQQTARLSSRIRVHGAHEVLLTPELLEIVTELAGRQPSSVQEIQFLLSPPNQGAWTLEGMNWHVDVKAEALDRAPGVQAFFLVDDVMPRGGATLALAGSHRVKQVGLASQSRLREALKSHLNLEDSLRDFDLRLLEMSGQAGDVYLMDMRTLHAPSVNNTNNMRIMATCRFLLDW